MLCILLAKVKSFPLTPLAVPLSEGDFADQIDALAIPKGHDNIHPFLAVISAVRVGEQLVHIWKDLIGEKNESIL